MSTEENKKELDNRTFEIILPAQKSKKELNLYASRIPAGFPSPAEDFIEKRLDLNDYIINNKDATFLVKATGNSMENAGIYDGDILVIDRSVEATSGRVVLGVLNGEFTVKRILWKKNKLFLVPENKEYKPMEINEEEDFQIWGVVTFSVHKL